MHGRLKRKKTEQRIKRFRRISDGVVADKIRVLSAAEYETESLQLQSLIKGCTAPNIKPWLVEVNKVWNETFYLEDANLMRPYAQLLQ